MRLPSLPSRPSREIDPEIDRNIIPIVRNTDLGLLKSLLPLAPHGRNSDHGEPGRRQSQHGQPERAAQGHVRIAAMDGRRLTREVHLDGGGRPPILRCCVVNAGQRDQCRDRRQRERRKQQREDGGERTDPRQCTDQCAERRVASAHRRRCIRGPCATHRQGNSGGR
jgi:hypothetical protein